MSGALILAALLGAGFMAHLALSARRRRGRRMEELMADKMTVALAAFLLFLVPLSVIVLTTEATAPAGWTEVNGRPSSNNWQQLAVDHITWKGDGSGTSGSGFSYLINDNLAMTDLQFTGRLMPMSDGVNTAIGVVVHWADIDNHTYFLLFEDSGAGKARIVREHEALSLIQHQVAIEWQDGFEYPVDIRVFNDTVLANVTDPTGTTYQLAGSIPTEHLNYNQMGLVAWSIPLESEAEWRGFSFQSDTNPKDVIVEDAANHVAFPSGYTTASNLTVVYREASIHGLDTNARLMQAVSTDEGSTWSAPSVWMDVAGEDERDWVFLRLQNDTLLAAGRLVSADNQVWLRWSTDDGVTWSALHDVGNFLGETEEALAGFPIQLRNGTVLLTMYDVGSPPQPSWVVWSDDLVTWDVLGQLDSTPSEWTIAELRNETLWAAIRGPSSAFYYSWSTDGGLTWEPIRQYDIDEIYDGVTAFPAWFQLPSGNLFYGSRGQLEGTEAQFRSRVNLALLNPDPELPSFTLVVLDAYDRVDEGHIDDYGYVDIIRISDGRYYFTWYDNSTSSIEGRLIVEGELWERQVTGIWTGVTNIVGIESFVQYNSTVYDGFQQTQIDVTVTVGTSVDIIVNVWNLTTPLITNFSAEADAGTIIRVTVGGLEPLRDYNLTVDDAASTNLVADSGGVVTFDFTDFSIHNFTLEEYVLQDEAVSWLLEFGPAWAALLVGSAFILFIVAAVVGGVRRRKRTGRIWKYMPKRWR